MIVKGPNRRNDFHIDPYDEIFYQLKGTIYVKHRDAAGHTQVAEVKEGEVMIINAFTPHLPIRPPETLGLVIERPRVAGEEDGIIWYCDACGKELHQLALDCQDIETQLSKRSMPSTLTWHCGRAQVVAACSPIRLSNLHGSRWYEPVRETPDQSS